MLSTGSKMERARSLICCVRGRRYKLGKNDGTEGIRILLKIELCKKAIKVQRKSDRVMAMVLVFEEEVIRVICVYAPQVGRLE